MKTTATFFNLVVISVLGLACPAWAGSFTISNTQTSAQSLSSSGQTGTVTLTGTLNVTTSGTPAVTMSASSSLVNSGTIEQTSATSSGRAVRASNTGSTFTITNNATGLITSNGDDAFQMNKTGSVTIYNYGTISTTSTLNLTGTDTGTGQQGLNMNILSSSGTTTAYTNTVYNYAGGTISTFAADAVRPGAGGIIYNSGTILSTNTSANTTNNTSSSDAIDLQQNNSGATIINAASQTAGAGAANLIEGARHGITGGQQTDAYYIATTPVRTSTKNGLYDVPFTLSVTNNTGGTIKGDNGSGINIDGVDSSEVVTVNNAGTITGNGVTRDGDGIDVDGLVNVTNSGLIQSLSAYGSTSEGLTVGGGTITNSGTIQGLVTGTGSMTTGSVGRGITFAGIDHTTYNGVDTDVPIQKIYGTTSVVNSGLIKGDSDAGIAIAGSATTGTSYDVTITNTLGGTIEGKSSTVAVIDGSVAVGGSVSPTASTNNETIINYGMIKQDGSGKAISLGSGNNSVQIMGGSASVLGDMSGGTLTGTNTAALTIDPTTGQSFSYDGVISNFTSVDIKSGSVTFNGANTYHGTTSIEGILTLGGSGTIGTTTTLTISNTGTFNLGGGTVSVVNLNNSGKINNGSVTTTGTGTVSGLSGSTSFNKNSAGTTTITGTNTYTGGTTVSNGKLAVDGSITGSVTVQSGGELGGHGSIGGTIGGAGAVGPGNSPGILTASSVDPSGGTSFNFEFTQGGAATWSNASASGNDVLHLEAALPFTSALTSANVINLYFSGLSLTYEGGFFVDGSTNTLSANIANATYNYFLLDNSSGTITYNGNKYDAILASHVVGATTQITGANFGDGTVNGFTQTFYVSTTAVPEPSTYVLLGAGLLGLMLVARRRNLNGKNS